MMTNKINQKNRFTLKSIILGIVATILVTMSLLHFPFKKNSQEYESHYKTYDDIITAREKAITTLNLKLGNTLTIDKYKVAYNTAWLLYKNKIREYKIKKKKLIKEQTFLGRASFKFWLFQFGLILLGFYFSVKSLFDDYRKKIKTGHEIISLIGISVCLFWFYHLFFKTAQDFYTETYVAYEILICIATGVLISRIVKYFVTKHNIIQGLVDLILRIKTKHYRKMAVNALYAERNDKSILSTETVKEQTNAFDADVKSTIYKILN